MAKDVMGLSEVKTVNGKDVSIKVVDGKVMVGDATVTKADIPASNGVIHVIDTVLLPEFWRLLRVRASAHGAELFSRHATPQQLRKTSRRGVTR